MMAMSPPDDGELDTLLAYIHERRNFDFRGYKQASLSRRIYKRMQALGVEDYQRYIDVLEANPGEFAGLFDAILINVTSLMRDRDAWEHLAAEVLPDIARKDPAEPVRVWSAGCASGEEAYTLAVLLAEALGEDRFRRQVKVYATDADADALVDARHGRYSERDLVTAFGEQRVERFFERDDGLGTFRPDLRRSLIFGRHDLVQDAPISRIDLLVCRNTLMYFTAEVQRQVLASFHFGLNPGGYLFLGRSEALVSRTRLFTAVDLRRHIFRKDGSPPDPPATAQLPTRTVPRPAPPHDRLAEVVLEHSPSPLLVLDTGGVVLLANLQARRLFANGSVEVGSPLTDGPLTLRASELLPLLEQAARERRVLTVSDVGRSPVPEGPSSYDLVLFPLEGLGTVGATLVDVSRYQVLREDLERSQRELEAAYEELQSAVEELETTNEELQSTNEELETTNEELHSANEELETMNEELQSANEELETINNELRDRSAEVNELNMFLQSILASLTSAVVVLGPEMEVRAWNRQAEDLWGLRASEVDGQHFLNLDIGYPVESLRAPIRACLAGRSEAERVTHHAVNRRGRTVRCAVSITQLVSDDGIRGVILLMDTTPANEDPAPALS